jgi:pimeloyl-ACP methyl ester carboxylesterase
VPEHEPTTAGTVTNVPESPVAAPVVLVHGWGGSFHATWESTGFTELLRDAGRTVIGVDLLGHGDAPKPHDPAQYADLSARIVDVLPDEPVDAIGFSLGAITLLHLAARAPQRFRRVVLAGIGRTVVEPDTSDNGTERIIAAIEGAGDPADTAARVFAQHAHRPGNDPHALVAALRRPRPPAVDFSALSCPTLVVIGDKDFAGPGDPLAAALPDARLVTLRNVDHFATPESFGFIDAALDFIDAVPG